MKKIVLFCLCISVVLCTTAQELDKTAAMQLVSKNLNSLGISQQELSQLVVSNAYVNKIPGTEMVYLQQTHQNVPVLNHLLVLAFKNGSVVSQSGNLFKGFQKAAIKTSAIPSVTAETAVRTALAEKKLVPTSAINAVKLGERKYDFGKAGVTEENITAELLWALSAENKMHLVWQVVVAPKKTSDYFLIRIDAHENRKVGEDNLTIYCIWGGDKEHSGAGHQHNTTELINPGFHIASSPVADATGEITGTNFPAQGNFSPLSPSIVNSASYRVIPFPAENPLVPGGAHALVTNPWNAAPGNATSLKWHSDGTTDFNHTRGNNTWAYHDRLNTNTPSVTRSAISTTAPDPLSFDFTPDFTKPAFQTNPVQNQQFNITNLFYWTNIIHDITYQYGFDEVNGNFQANNQGRGGAGNDYLRAEAQDGNGNNNANFLPTVDGTTPRMQMFLWDGELKMTVNTPASIARAYVIAESDFSTANKLAAVGPVTAQVVYYNDDATGTMHEACAAPANTLTGKIALIDRGNCSFVIKVKNAQDAGAVAVIMVNNIAGDPPLIMGGTDNTITIPAVMITQADGVLIKAQLANNVNVTLSNLELDGDVDNGIVVHEFTHGISNRLTGGPATNTCLSNAEQMGEGWSDYFALMLTQNWAASNVNTGFTTPRSIGLYALNGDNLFAGSTPGTGIRHFKYCTDFSVNSQVYMGNMPTSQHDRGETWCATLWDMTWNIIQQVNSITPNIYNANGTGGNIIALKLVTEGMKLQPCNPGFIDGRDAILKADQLLYGGLYSCAIREAFRKRGMGAFASQGSASSVTDQSPDFTAYINVTLTQNVTQVPEGQNIIYTKKVVSCGPVSNYLLTDTLPANVTYVSGGNYNAGTRVVSFPVNFAAAGTQNYVLTVNVNTGSYYAPTTYLDEQVTTSTVPATLTPTSTTTSVWSVSTGQSNSPPNAMFTPDPVGVSEQLLTTTNNITLGANQSSLSFWHSFSTEPGFDGGVIEISTDNGTSWTDLGNKFITGYYNSSIDATNGIPISGKPAFTGQTTGFMNTKVNLSSYAGSPVKLRWAFYSDLLESAPGWYVDDILVKNEAVVNMRTSFFNSGGTRLLYRDTVTLITQTLVCTNAAISTQPVDITACAGSGTSLSVAATGTTLSYQWQVSTDGGATYTNLAGATTATLNLAAVTAGMNNNRYRVVVSNACPSTVTSSAAVLTVTNPSAISTQPTSITVCTGANATFTVTATGSNLTYQWELSTNNGSSWTPITGATNATLVVSSVTAALNNYQYRVQLSSCVAGGLTSAAATLTVNASAAITTQPVNTTVCGGSAATFTVAATGTAIGYQWQLSTDGGASFSNIPGATAATLSLPAVTTAMNNHRYRVIVTNACPSSVTSAIAILTVTSPSVISQQPVNTTVCSGNNTSFSVTATGTALTYQWQVSTNSGTSWTDINGATAASLPLNTVTIGMNNNQYRVILSSCSPGGLTSSPAILTVNAGVDITAQPLNLSACSGTNATFTVTANGTALNYQWQVSTNGGATFTNVTGATTATLTLPAVTAAMNNNQYRATVSNACPSSVNSSIATLTVSDVTAISSQPANVTVCSGTNTSFAVTATGTNLTYQWQQSTDAGTTWTNIPAATGSTLTLSGVTAAMNNNRYRVVMSSCVAGGLTSAAATLNVNAAVNITTQPASTTACTGNNATLTSVVSGSGLTYQWQVSTDAGASWTDVPGATNSSLALTAVTAAMNGNRYRLIINGTCTVGAITSNVATLTINNSINISQQPVSTTLCAGLDASFSANASGSGLTYQWQVSTNGGSSFTNLAGATSATLNLPAVTPGMNANQYRANLNGDCVSNLFTNVATLTVNSSVNIVTQPTSQVGCAPVPATFRVTATGTSVTYQWELSTNGGTTWSPVAGETTSSLSIPSLTPSLSGNQYRVVVAGVPCGTLTSNAATLTVGQLPSVTISASTTTVSPTMGATLTATPNPAGTYTYQWFKDNVPVAGVTTNTYVVTIDKIGTYKAIANSSNGCNNTSNDLVITGAPSQRLFVYPNPNYGLFQVRFYTDPSLQLARTINVFDPRGAKIFTKVYTVLTPYDRMEVDLGGVPGGVYYLELLDASGKRVASAGITKF